MNEAFEDAYRDCLKHCFEILTDGLVPAIDGDEAEYEQAAERFRKCCALCGKARLIAQLEKDQ